MNLDTLWPATHYREMDPRGQSHGSMKSYAWWDETQDIARINVVGALDATMAHIVGAQLRELLDAQPKPWRLLVDQSEAQGKFSREARMILVADFKTLEFDRVAVYGMTNINRMVGRILATMMGRSERTMFFASQEQALAWLSSS